MWPGWVRTRLPCPSRWGFSPGEQRESHWRDLLQPPIFLLWGPRRHLSQLPAAPLPVQWEEQTVLWSQAGHPVLEGELLEGSKSSWESVRVQAWNGIGMEYKLSLYHPTG